MCIRDRSRNTQYRVQAIGYGYVDSEILTSPAPKSGLEISLQKTPVDLHLEIVDQFGIPLGDIEGVASSQFHQIPFITEWTGKTTMTLPPGEYSFSINQNKSDGNDGAVYVLETFVTKQIYPGSRGETLQIQVTEKAKITINLTNDGAFDLKLENEQGVIIRHHNIEGNITSYIPVGNYVLTAQQGNDYRGNFELKVDTPKNVDITVPPSYRLEGYLRYGETTSWFRAPVKISGDDGFEEKIVSNLNGRYEAYLPDGTYTLKIDHIEATTTFPIEYHWYTGMDTVTVDGGTVLNDILLDMERYDTTYRGVVKNPDGTPAMGVTLLFEPMDKQGIYAETVTDTEGKYHVKLAPAKYEIEVPSTEKRKTYLDTFTAEHYKDTLYQNLTLVPSIKIRGTVKEGSNVVKTTVSITGENGIKRSTVTSNTGYYQFYLPEGTYTVESYKVISQKNYTARTVVTLVEDTVTNLYLTRTPAREPYTHFNPVQVKTFRAGEELSYLVTVRNDGDISDIYDLSLSPAIFGARASETSLELEPGESERITVTMQITEDIKVEHEPLVLNVVSRYDTTITKKQELDFAVSSVSNVALDQLFRPSPWVENGKFITTMSLKNTGNHDDVFDVEILNLKELKEKGWTVNLTGGGAAFDGVALNNLTIDLDKKEVTLTLKLTPTRDRPSRDFEVLLSARSKNDPESMSVTKVKYDTPVLELDKKQLEISGEFLSYTDDFQFPYWTIMLLIAAMALGISGYLYVRTRRW